MVATSNCSASAALAAKLAQEAQRGVDEVTPSTTSSYSDDEGDCNTCSATSSCSSSNNLAQDAPQPPPPTTVPKQLQPGIPGSGLPSPCAGGTVPKQLQPGIPGSGLPSPCAGGEDSSGSACSRPSAPQVGPPNPCRPAAQTDDKIRAEDTFFIFDWDDTVLPSTWVQRQGLRLDTASQPNEEQRELLAEVATAAGKTLRAARQHGTVVLVTNAERGWIELSCQKFLPTLSPTLENMKLVSARTTYECPQCSSPLDWKLRAFEAEINHYFGSDAMMDQSKRKNVLSLGDSVHEREALLRATTSAPNCHSKSLKFVERPDISQICKQHELITNCFDRIVHHEGNLDLCIRCP